MVQPIYQLSLENKFLQYKTAKYLNDYYEK